MRNSTVSSISFLRVSCCSPGPLPSIFAAGKAYPSYLEKKMPDKVQKFKEERQRLNKIVLSRENPDIKRFFALDSAVYRKGALDAKTKELLGLAASLVLRCDDCISYHAIRAKEIGTTDEEFDEVVAIGLVVGGSITIPHIRRAGQLWEDIKS
jgi:AhpD family alkylhydroperoxidase